ncbi:MAG: hypothetical protein U0271_11050 [Polyangiaceae bacterium]
MLGETFHDTMCAVFAGTQLIACDTQIAWSGSATMNGMIEAAGRPYGKARSLSLSANGGCLVRPNGKVACFGSNDGGSKGLVARDHSATPVKVLFGPLPDNATP